MDNNRKTAYQTLLDVESKKAYSNIALNHKIAVNKPSTPAFVRELVYGVLERKLTLDYYIDQLLTEGIDSLKTPEITILRMGIYQLGYMEKVPEYAAVSECVDLAKKYCKGRAGLINGVLREYQNKKIYLTLPARDEDEIKYLSIKYSYAPWIIELWLKYYSMSFVEQLLEAGNQTPPLTVRANWLKIRKEDLKKAFRERGFEVEDGKLAQNALNVKGSKVLDSELYRYGLFTPQDESSMLVSEKIGVKQGDLVMDVCAAPGGKTTAIAERMNNTGKIIASDIYRRKLDLVDKEAKRLGITNIETRSWDATRVDSTMVKKADKVLVDAPCSGHGVVRRKPEIKYRELSEDIMMMPKKQADILSASSSYVKPGGTLVYSTCTINPEENEKIIDQFLKRNRDFEKVERTLLLPNVNGTDGFFICVMKRNELME